MNLTNIEWTTFSANPLKYRDAAGKSVWACVHHSPGCVHCYAETLAKRYGRGGPFSVPTTSAVTPFLDEKELRKILTADRIGKQSVAGSMIFIGDMTDVAGSWVPDDMLDVLLALALVRKAVVIQILTKRIDRLRHRMHTLLDEAAAANQYFRPAFVHHAGVCLKRQGLTNLANYFYGAAHNLAGDDGAWPSNLWIGASAEDQQRADERIPLLLQTPAAVRFVSAEPLIGPIDLRQVVLSDGDELGTHLGALALGCGIDWVIVGGESGPGARPCAVDWMESLIQQCRDAGVACFMKQLGSNPRWAGAESRPIEPARGKGGDMDEWPIDLRVRQFPEPAGDRVSRRDRE